MNNLNVANNLLLKSLTINKESQEEYAYFLNFQALFQEYDILFTFERLIEIFEFVISPSDKIVNGAVYTPPYIREFIVKSCYNKLDIKSKISDISCGCGGFLFDFAKKLKTKYGKTFYEIFKENIYGVDITNYSIIRTKILLSILALSKGEDIPSFKFNLFVKNSLEFNWFEEVEDIRNNNGFDIIVGNPPYVGANHIDEISKKLLKSWSVASIGKADLYIPFFQIGLKWLKPKGFLGYITVNNFYRSLNGRKLRCYLNGQDITLIDFGAEQVFKGKNTYTCICLINKRKGNMKYSKCPSSSIHLLQETDFININYESLDNEEGWLLDNYSVKSNMSKIENIGEKLGDKYAIRNGLATLRNEIYIFKPIKEIPRFFFLTRNGKSYKIEKSICRNVIKPNVLKKENEIEILKEKIIFPYKEISEADIFGNKTKKNIVITESEFTKKYPHAYNYLTEHKNELSKRDKGKKKYENWFAFGRTQALNIQGQKLFLPYMSNRPYFVYSSEENLLFYNGYAIISDNEKDLLFIKKILLSNVFWYYVKHKSKPYTGGYFSLAKNYIKNFGIPDFTTQERTQFMRLKKESSINNFLMKKYKIII
ncbi:MAG: N-6 DNA methylase [Chitinophagales bacterium]